MEGSSNWAGLPPELLLSISDRLPVADYARFPAVCSSWASSIGDLPPKPPSSSHFPWLAFIPADPTAPLTFLNRPENHRRYQIPAAVLPVFNLGHRDGWLAAVLRDYNVLLLNPLTSATSRLPSILTLLVNPFGEGLKCVDKIVLSASQDGESPTAVVAYGGTLVDQLAFARPGDSEWTPLHAFEHYYDNVDDVIEVVDVVYHDGKFFVIFTDEHMLSLYLSGLSPVVSLLATAGMNQKDDDISGWYDGDLERLFLVSAPSGDLLQVRKLNRIAGEGKVPSFDVLRFDEELDGWVEVDGLGGGGDWSLFLDDKGSVVLSGMPGMDGNRIFFVDSSHSGNKKNFKVGVYDFGKGTAETFFPEDISFDETTYRLLIWFRPSLL